MNRITHFQKKCNSCGSLLSLCNHQCEQASCINLSFQGLYVSLKKKCNSLSFYEIENNLILPNVIGDILNRIFSKEISIANIRETCFKLKEITIPNNEVLKGIMIRIINDKSIIDLKKYKIINSISEYDKLLQKAYRDIIYLESLFIRILNIIHN